MHNINEKLFFIINGLVGKSNFLDGFFVFVTHFFVPATFIISVIWFFFIIPKKSNSIKNKILLYKEGLLFLFSVGLVALITEIIKRTVAFPRPVQILSGVQSLVIDGNFDSFPSMHSALAFAVATTVYYQSKKAGILLFIFAILVAISRIFVGVHFPIDVLVGALLGVIIPFFLRLVFKRYNI